MRMSIDVLCERMVRDLDALAARIDQLLPEADESRYQKSKSFTRADWRRFYDKYCGKW